MSGAPQSDEFGRTVGRWVETTQPPRPGAATRRRCQDHSELRLNGSETPEETGERCLALIIKEVMYPPYTKISIASLPEGRAALPLRLKLRADPGSDTASDTELRKDIWVIYKRRWDSILEPPKEGDLCGSRVS